MAHVFQTFTRDGRPHPRWRYQFTDWQGRRRTATGTTSEIETRRKATAIQAEHFDIRKGLRPAPNSAQRHSRDLLSLVVNEYLDWGRSQGGKNGNRWSHVHARMRQRHLGWWMDKLKLDVLGDLNGALARVEHALRALQAKDAAGKTVQNRAESLKAFCAWCVQRNYLEENPLAGLVPFDTTSRTFRRSLTFDEAAKLIEAAPPHRALLYRVALVTGLRVNELRSLTLADLDEANCGLHLRAEWTKNRKAGFQRLSPELVEAIKEAAAGNAPGKPPERFRSAHDTTYTTRPTGEAAAGLRLLYVPSHAARDMAKDLAAAGIERKTFGGKLDFHACRTSFTTFVDQGGATAKEIQTAARHSNPTITMRTYVKIRADRMSEIACGIDRRLQPPNIKQTELLPLAKAAGAENLDPASACDERALLRVEGSNPSALTRENETRAQCAGFVFRLWLLWTIPAPDA